MASLQNDFLDFLGLFTQPQAPKGGREVEVTLGAHRARSGGD